MVKAWDPAELVAALKSRGLDVAEDMAGIVLEESLKFVHDSIVLSETKIDDIALPFLPMVEGPLKALVDKINGKVG